MSLADVWDSTGPGKYLQEGWHEVTVTDCKVHSYNSGNNGVEFIVENEAGTKSKVDFVLLPQCWWKLANFAKACGLTREMAAKYDPNKDACHRMLLRKRLKVHVFKNGQYHEVDDYVSIDESVSDVSTNPRLVRPEAPPTGKDIPF